MKKRNLGCIALSLILALGCLAGCGDDTTLKPADTATPPAANCTVTFDVGEEARAAGVTTPAAQTVMNGYTAVEPTVDYWEGHELDGWYNGSTEWNFTSDKVTADTTLTASWVSSDRENVAKEYEANLDWGTVGHLYIHYLRGADKEAERGTVNDAAAPNYDAQIASEVYGDWGLWAWEYKPVPSEGRAFFPMKLDESGAVYDVDLTTEWDDGGWDSDSRTHKTSHVDYSAADWMGIQFFSQDSRLHGTGFWVNDGGDIYIQLDRTKRDKGDYHWFVRQGETQNGSPTFESYVVFDPYEGLEPGSAISSYDVVSNQGNTTTYTQQPVAEGWEEDSVGYQIFVASFADSDGDGFGDLRGIIEKLDYLEDLGVDVLWLTPFQQSNSYHGYDIQDYFTVDTRFGTLADYRELVTEAHARGMKILMDFVLNHTSTSNPWFVKSTKLVKEVIELPDGRKKEIDYRNFYTWQNEDYVNSITDPLERNQWYKDANGYYYFSSFNSSMPELNFDYQAVRDAILEVALYWMSFGLDGFRLDAVKHIYMENENPNHSDNIVKDIADGSVIGGVAGDYSYDVDKNVHFFLEFNAKLKATYPSALLVGENLTGDPFKLAQLYPGLDSLFDFNFYYDTTGCLATTAYKNDGYYSKKLVNEYYAAQFDYSMYRSDFINSIFTSNHDVQRARERVLAAWSDDAGDWVERRVTTASQLRDSEALAKIWACMCLTLPGITWIYNGDELGMFGSKTANPAADGPGHEDRWLRQAFKWTTARESSSYNCYYPIGFNNYYMEWDANNQKLDGLAEQQQVDDSIYAVYKKLIEVRHSSAAFRSGTVEMVRHPLYNSWLISYTVSNDTDTYEILINPTVYARKMTPDELSDMAPSGTLVYTNSDVKSLRDNGYELPQYSFFIYKVQ